MNVIFLIGFMGVGKSTLGRQIASSIHADFIDTDFEIEKMHQSKINLLISQHGEGWFRNQESQLLTQLAENNPNADSKTYIVSCGGGFPCFNDSMSKMNEIGTTIYLHLPTQELYQRLLNKRDKRPLIKDLNDTELKLKIEALVNEREFYYNQANYKVSLSEKSIFNAYKAILETCEHVIKH